MHMLDLYCVCILYGAFMSVESLGQLLKTLRKAQGLSQQQLGQAVGMSRATISGLENNTVAEVGLRKVESVLNALGYSITAAPVQQRPRLGDVVRNGGFHGDDYGQQ